MTDEAIIATGQARAIIRAAERRAFAWGFLPLPLVDIAAVSYTQLQMIDQLAAHYNVPYSEVRARPLLTALLGSLLPAYFGSNLAYTLLRGSGVGRLLALVSLPTSFGGATRVIGKLFAEHFHNGGTLENFDLVTHPEPTGAEEPRPQAVKGTPDTASAREPAATTEYAPATDVDEPSAERPPRLADASADDRVAALERQVARLETTIDALATTVQRDPGARAEAEGAANNASAERFEARLEATLIALRAELERVSAERPAETATLRHDVAELTRRVDRVQRSLDAALARAAPPQSASDAQLQSIRRCMTDRDVLVDVLDSAVAELRAGLSRAPESR